MTPRWEIPDQSTLGKPNASWRGAPSRGGFTAARSHSLSRSYRAVLPTSLGRVIPSPEVVRLGDLLRFSVRSLLSCASFQGAAGRARVPRAVQALGLNPSPAPRRVMLGRRPAALVGGVDAALVSPCSQAAGMCAGVPFGACEALAVRLGPGHPGAVAVAQEAFSTSVVLRALSLLQPRSGPGRGPGDLKATVRAAPRHALPGGRQRRVGRGLQRDQFSGRTDSAGEL